LGSVWLEGTVEIDEILDKVTSGVEWSEVDRVEVSRRPNEHLREVLDHDWQNMKKKWLKYGLNWASNTTLLVCPSEALILVLITESESGFAESTEKVELVSSEFVAKGDFLSPSIIIQLNF
jgi:hypothetical protein